MTLKMSPENELIDAPGLNRFRIGDHVIADECADCDRHEGIVVGIEFQRLHGTGTLVPSITLLHDGYLTDGFKPEHLRMVSPAPVDQTIPPFSLSTREWPKPGDKMRFRDENGYPSDLVAAREHFAKGQLAVVRDFRLGDWHSAIAFEGIPGHFNSVMFEHVDEEQSDV